jgi:hypothetical protein
MTDLTFLKLGSKNWINFGSCLLRPASLPADCEEHYVQAYIKGNLGEKTWLALPSESSPGIVDHTIPVAVDAGRIVMDESDMTALPLANIPQDEAIKLGFLPRRQDFELVRSHSRIPRTKIYNCRKC